MSRNLFILLICTQSNCCNPYGNAVSYKDLISFEICNRLFIIPANLVSIYIYICCVIYEIIQHNNSCISFPLFYIFLTNLGLNDLHILTTKNLELKRKFHLAKRKTDPEPDRTNQAGFNRSNSGYINPQTFGLLQHL